MFQRAIAVITIGTLLSACATGGVFRGGNDDCSDGKCLAVVVTIAVMSGIVGIAESVPAPAKSEDTPLAHNRRERKILRQAASGQCSAAVKAYQALRTTDLAAAGRLQLDDKLSTCIALEDARARGTIRSLGHD